MAMKVGQRTGAEEEKRRWLAMKVPLDEIAMELGDEVIRKIIWRMRSLNSGMGGHPVDPDGIFINGDELIHDAVFISRIREIFNKVYPGRELDRDSQEIILTTLETLLPLSQKGQSSS